MTDNHKELCDWFRREAYEYDNGDNYRSAFLKAAALIESQAKQIAGYVEQHGRDSAELRRLCAARDEANARARQQALEYVSLFDQCSQHLAMIAELEGELEATRQERNAAGVRARQELMPAYELRIAELAKERDALKADVERLDSGCIVTHERDEFGAEYECERRGVDLRARIDAAMEINKRQSERPDWAECESRGPLVRNSLKHRASELTTAANKCRRAYQKDFMRIPLEWLADAYDEAAAALNRRLSSIAALQAEKETR